MSTSNLGQLIRQLRKEQGLTQPELAVRHPLLSQAYVSAVERGKLDRPSLERLHAFADALGVPYNRLAAAAGFMEGEEDGDAPAARAKGTTEQILEDILAVTADRPDLIKKLRAIRERGGEAAYRRALRILHRHMVMGIDLAGELAQDEGEDGSDAEE